MTTIRTAQTWGGQHEVAEYEGEHFARAIGYYDDAATAEKVADAVADGRPCPAFRAVSSGCTGHPSTEGAEYQICACGQPAGMHDGFRS